MRRTARQLVANHQRAFTLIEMMIVIVVILALVGLLTPAIMRSFRTARNTQVTVEIRGIEAAIANFKSVYGMEPPSRIRLYETGTGAISWSTHAGTFVEPITGATVTHDSERTRSIGLMNKIWPNFNFNTLPGIDFNGDGSYGGYISLTGPECLVFFLGGRPTGPVGGPFAMTGFSKNPANPFLPAAGSESREGPFYEFRSIQLKPSLNPTNPTVLVYCDPSTSQLSPYLYVSSYDGRGYQLPDLFVGPGNNLTDVYRSTNTAPFIAQKPKSFQIICPGNDGFYGTGGYFNPSGPNHGLTNRRDYDNITNFHNTVLNE